MDTLLLLVTAVSLVAALVLGWTAWRLARAERERAMARVAALAAAVADTPPQPSADPHPRAAEPPASDVRPQWSSPARPRSSARITAMRPAVEEIEWAPPRPEELPLRTDPGHATGVRDAFLGSASQPSGGGQRLLGIAAVLLLFALGAAGAWLYSTPSSTASTAAALSSQTPLELMSLRHAREGDRLSITGMVRNPASAPSVTQLSATVLLFDQQGGYLTSARGPIDVPRLDPGQESPFTLSVQAPVGATRYRVSFRTDERIVPHVDRRGGQVPAPSPAAATSSLPAQAAAR